MVYGTSWTRDTFYVSNTFSVCMIAAWFNLFPFVESVVHILKNESYASARCNIHMHVRSSVGPVRGCDSIRVRKDVSSRDNKGRKFQRESTLCCLVVSSSNTGSIKACMWTAGRSDGIKINVHTEELNKCLIPDNETATAEGKDQLQLRVQQEVDWFTTSNCHLFSTTEEFIESLWTNKE